MNSFIRKIKTLFTIAVWLFRKPSAVAVPVRYRKKEIHKVENEFLDGLYVNQWGNVDVVIGGKVVCRGTDIGDFVFDEKPTEETEPLMENPYAKALALALLLSASLCFAFTSGDGTYENPYEIAGQSDIVNLIDMVATNDCSGLYFLQTADIDLSPFGNFQGIGGISADLATTNAFSGNYDGDGYVLSNMTINATSIADNSGSKYYGFFNAVENAIIANVSVQGKIVVKANAKDGTKINIGSIVAGACGSCLFEGLDSYVDIYYENPSPTSDYSSAVAWIGGVLGSAILTANNTWTAVKNYGNIVVNSPLLFSACGVFGYYERTDNSTSPNIVGFENYGKISSTSYSSSSLSIADALGIGYAYAPSSTKFTKCVNFGDITITGGVLYASGLFATTTSGQGSSTYTSCANYGNIALVNGRGNPQCLSGLLNNSVRSCSINSSTNSGNIYVQSVARGRYELSGIASFTSSTASPLTSTFNFGDITFVGTNTSGTDEVSVGGLVSASLPDMNTTYTLTACGNFGNLSIASANNSSSAKFGIGGIGCLSSPTSASRLHSANLKNCVNFGRLEMNVPSDFGGIADVAGLIGAYSETKNDVKINWSYNLGTLKWGGRNVRVGGLMGLEEATTASDEYTHIDHSYSVCSYNGSLEGNYVGSIVGYAKSTTAPITVSNSFGVAINRSLPAFGYFDNAYTNNVKGYAWEEVYRDLNISGFYLPSSKFNQPSKTTTYYDLICPMNTDIFPTDTDEAKRLHNAVLVNGYKRYIRTIQQ